MKWKENVIVPTACAFDIHLYLTPLGQARKFIETCGTYNLPCGRKFVCFWAGLFFSARVDKKINILPAQYKQISTVQAGCTHSQMWEETVSFLVHKKWCLTTLEQRTLPNHPGDNSKKLLIEQTVHFFLFIVKYYIYIKIFL